MSRREMHALAAVLLIFGGLSMVFTSTVEGAVIGLGASIVAGIVVFLARNR